MDLKDIKIVGIKEKLKIETVDLDVINLQSLKFNQHIEFILS